MEPKEFDITFPRGDTCPIEFELTDLNGNELQGDYEIYFTIKKNYRTQEYIIQKRYSRGEITLEGIKGIVVLSHSDTAELNYGKYNYDIQIKSDEYVKTLVLGEIELTDESTWLENE